MAKKLSHIQHLKLKHKFDFDFEFEATWIEKLNFWAFSNRISEAAEAKNDKLG